MFETSRPFSSQELRWLGPAAPFETALIGVHLEADKLRIWGEGPGLQRSAVSKKVMPASKAASTTVWARGDIQTDTEVVASKPHRGDVPTRVGGLGPTLGRANDAAHTL